jgi:pyruvate dehydrogenase E1 component alpha subunit
MQAIQSDDYVISAYREHGHALAKGMDPKPAMAELYGKRTGSSQGKGGSMHLFDSENHFLGGHGIVAGQIPLAAGIGFAIRYRKEPRVCLAFFGDGAVNQGTFHEALNLVGLWKLPVVLICENNLYAMGTRVDRATAITNIYERAESYSLNGATVDGNEVIEVYEAVHEAVERARSGEGGTLLEARTYRFRGHSMSDPAKYRTRDEVDARKRDDPILSLGEHLVDNGFATEEGLKETDNEVKAEIKDAVRFASESPEPTREDLFTHIIF